MTPFEIPEEVLYEGIVVDLEFQGERPTFGDLFAICGFAHPRFPETGRFNFSAFKDLKFSQVDDYFGVETVGAEGEDVAIWLYPTAAGRPVEHHLGPFDGLRVTYCPLRNPRSRGLNFLSVVTRLSKGLDVRMHSNIDGQGLAASDVESRLGAALAAVEAYWAQRDIQLGSSEALQVDF